MSVATEALVMEANMAASLEVVGMEARLVAWLVGVEMGLVAEEVRTGAMAMEVGSLAAVMMAAAEAETGAVWTGVPVEAEEAVAGGARAEEAKAVWTEALWGLVAAAVEPRREAMGVTVRLEVETAAAVHRSTTRRGRWRRLLVQMEPDLV